MRRSKTPKHWRPLQQAAIWFLGAMIFALGVLTLLRGRQYYYNYWGGAVFAPFAILIGGLCFFVGYVKRKARFSSADSSIVTGTRRNI